MTGPVGKNLSKTPAEPHCRAHHAKVRLFPT